MRLRPLGFLSSLLVSAGLVACGSGPGDATGSTCPNDSKLTYANFGQAFFQANCLACHGPSGPQSPKLDSVAGIRQNKDSIDRSAAAGPSAVNTYMPESGSVAEAERRKLGEWLACGSPD
jgi:mono/diheme cytochrome c family protein